MTTPSPDTPSAPDRSSERRAALFAALAAIPAGSVTTYGQLAEAAGLGRAARWVGRILRQLPDDTELPWHRVVAAGGRLALTPDSPAGRAQRQRLAAEGVLPVRDRVDMHEHDWRSKDRTG